MVFFLLSLFHWFSFLCSTREREKNWVKKISNSEKVKIHNNVYNIYERQHSHTHTHTHTHMRMWMWINMSGFTFTINLKACKLYKRSDEKRVKIRFKTTNTQTHNPKTFIKQTIQDIYSEKILLSEWMSVRAYVHACVRMCECVCVCAKAYFIWGTRNLIFKLAFCNSILCGCRCSFYFFALSYFLL